MKAGNGDHEQPELTADQRGRLETLVELLAADPSAPSSVTDPRISWDVHIADSLSGLAFEQLRSARSICDIGAGAGFPSLALAVVLPEARIVALDSVSRKCEFMRRACEAGGLKNVEVVDARAEDYARAGGAEAFDLITARAVGRLSTLAELASPLLPEGGHLLAWKGRRDPAEEGELARATDVLAMEPVEARWVGPYAGSENRHLHLLRKSGPTPGDLPRRSGMAKKRPRGAA